MKIHVVKSPTFIVIALTFLSSQSYADELKNQKLMQQLSQPLSEYHLPSLKDAVNPKLLNPTYRVNWIAEPEISLTAPERRIVKSSVQIKMSVVAKTGYVGKVQLLESSNLKAVDEKIKKAVLIASLQPIKGFDPNVVYTLDYTVILK